MTHDIQSSKEPDESTAFALTKGMEMMIAGFIPNTRYFDSRFDLLQVQIDLMQKGQTEIKSQIIRLEDRWNVVLKDRTKSSKVLEVMSINALKNRIRTSTTLELPWINDSNRSINASIRLLFPLIDSRKNSIIGTKNCGVSQSGCSALPLRCHY
jgi:hypothetical protein